MDIATMLQNGSDVDFKPDRPTKETIEEQDKEMREIMEEQAKTEYQAKAREWVARQYHYKQNQSVMCGLIMERCDTELSDRLESRPGYKEWTLSKPLVFLRVIKEECVAFKENENPCLTQHKIFKDLYNISQGTEESVADFAKRVRVLWELLTLSTSIFYTRINPKLHDDYLTKSDVERVILNLRTDKRYVAYVMVVGSDPSRFGRMKERLEESYDVGTDEYPRTIEDAKDYLDRANAKMLHDNERRDKIGSTDANVAKPGIQKVATDETLELSFATVRFCYVCGKKGHLAHNCRHRKKIPKDEWYIAQVREVRHPRRRAPIHRRTRSLRKRCSMIFEPMSDYRSDRDSQIGSVFHCLLG
jgi:hypothetical protein